MSVFLRLLIDPPLDGFTNMARDEALLDAVVAGESPLTLRFYQWSEPTISLGYFQAYAALESQVGPVREMAVVRRTTGGGAILHDRELTYALVVPEKHPLLVNGPTALYCRMHDAIIAVLNELGIPARSRGPTRCGEVDANDRSGGESSQAHGPFFCFARTHALDIVVGDRKLAGSAQRRASGGVLQHGSIVLEAVHAEQPSTAVGDYCPIAPDELAQRIARRFAQDNEPAPGTGFRKPGADSTSDFEGAVLGPDAWRPMELERAKTHVARYNSPAWTRLR